MIVICIIAVIAGAALAFWFGCMWYKQNKRMQELIVQIDHFQIHGKEPLQETLQEGIFANLNNQIARLEEQFCFYQSRGIKREEEMIHFVENMTHQMNNAVTALQIQLDLLQFREDFAESESYQKSQACLEQLKQDIDRILKASQLAEGKIRMVYEKLELREELMVCISRLHPIAAEREVAVRLEQGKNVWLQGDAFWLSQAFENILKNAIEHSRENQMVQIRLDDSGREVHIRVEDEGDGILQEDLPELFTRFSRGSAAKAGYGIGLAMAKDIIEAHHGTLTAGNRQKGGAWFEAAIPVLNGSKTYIHSEK